MKNLSVVLGVIAFSILFVSCQTGGDARDGTKAVIYHNGDIITMAEPLYAEAVRVEGGKITHIETSADIMKLSDRNTMLVDLKGKTLLPSFIDTHSHVVQLAQSYLGANLSEAKNFDDIVNLIKDHIAEFPPAPDAVITASGYDNNFLAEKKHPTREVLDKVSTEYPIIISHASGHMGVVNTKALELMGIGKNTPDVEGGLIERDENGEPTGYLEENAFINYAKDAVKPPSVEDMVNLVDKALDTYLRYGVTTVQEGLMGGFEFSILETMSQRGQLKADVIGFVDLKNAGELSRENKDLIGIYKNRFKIGGYKIFLDGSPQGKTAWLTKPYENSGDYRGYPIYTDAEVDAFVRIAMDDKMQLQSHCNGDAASDQIINSFKRIIAEKNLADTFRPVMIHCQTARPDQYPEMAKIGMIPSIFVSHIYYWGDIHLQNLGWERASRISASRSALNSNLPFTYHEDTPVIQPNTLESVWAGVNRITRNGVQLGDFERVDAFDALKAVTINAAYQNKEENSKGSLEPGKRADLVILSDNPLKTEAMDIRDIEVLETIKDGLTVFKK
ncbi:amidohydrolase [Breznakiella homolactica]|uniref:Amidohydrolase n=1 Tax=Breznakiella homolactica TaxID=2798577 RepID=A0A7T7XJS5_9SPIR|nr:amidohydrolase [Breznakiella homolactica]QQO07709.1 amidohydrolase [Breznakiella homolactica]